MTDLDRTLTTLLGEELARESDLIPPPPLADLERRAAHHRRRRWGAVAVAAAAAVVVGVAAVELWPGGSGFQPSPAPAGPTLPAGAESFEVPTFAWDPSEGGDAALVEGTVQMTEDGCAVIEHDGQKVGLVLPNARGIREGGRTLIYSTFPAGEALMAEEGMAISYGAGYHDSSPDWARLCPGSPVDAVAMVYDTGL